MMEVTATMSDDTLDTSPVVPPARRNAWLAAFVVPLVLAPAWPSLIGQLAEGHIVASRTGMILVLALVAAALTDGSHKKIYNWTTYPAFLLALLFNVLASVAESAEAMHGSLPVSDIGIGSSLLGALTCFVPMLIIRQFTGGGAGDVKLATVIGAVLGPEIGLKVLVNCYIIGGVCILAILIWRTGPVVIGVTIFRRIGSVMMPGIVAPPEETHKEVLRSRIALGPYFAASAVLVLSRLGESWFFVF
jgi:Flp pilus assembly protein protease CpaA